MWFTNQVLFDVAGEDPTREDVLDEVSRNKDVCAARLQEVCFMHCVVLFRLGCEMQ